MPSKAELRQKWDSAGENVVVLHQFYRAKTHPNASPFPMKLETYYRIAGIEYIVDFHQPMSDKGKSPWITFNKKDIADSQISLEHLIKQMPEKDISAHLSPEEKAVARGFRAVLEDHLYFCILVDRWVFGDRDFLKNELFGRLPFPSFLTNIGMGLIGKQLKKQAIGQGIGRHSKEEVYEMAEKDVKVKFTCKYTHII